MSTSTDTIEELATQEYKYGFDTAIEADTLPPGLNEDVVRAISAKQERAGVDARVAPEGLPGVAADDGAALAERHLSAGRLPGHQLLLGAEAEEAARQPRRDGPRGPRARSRSSASRSTSRRCSPAWPSTPSSTASRWRRPSRRSSPSSASSSARSPRRCPNHPELVRKYVGSVVPYTDNFYASLNSAVFSDGSFVYVPKGVRCPMELSTYFRINAKDTGQFERTLIVADEGAYVSYLEGCTAPMRDENQLHAAVVELVALDNAHDQVLRPSRTGTRATRTARAASTTS